MATKPSPTLISKPSFLTEPPYRLLYPESTLWSMFQKVKQAHLSFEPPILVNSPNPLMNRSFR